MFIHSPTKRKTEDMSQGLTHPMGKGKKKSHAQLFAMKHRIAKTLKSPMTKADHKKASIKPEAVANLKSMAPYGGR